MSNRQSILTVLFSLLAFVSFAQECQYTISGQVIDEGTKLPLPFVTVILQEKSYGVTTDDNGFYSLENICEGHFHLIFSHIGCEAHKFHLDISADTIVNINLSHSKTAIGTVTVHGEKNNDKQAQSSIDRDAIEDNSTENLSGLLENETGVYLIKN
ncbi:MAG: carboxypeptidase-like regulatory domain-containing protein, partial [Chitinophagales bacterium]